MYVYFYIYRYIYYLAVYVELVSVKEVLRVIK